MFYDCNDELTSLYKKDSVEFKSSNRNVKSILKFKQWDFQIYNLKKNPFTCITINPTFKPFHMANNFSNAPEIYIYIYIHMSKNRIHVKLIRL